MLAANGTAGPRPARALPRWLRWLIPPVLLAAFLGLRWEGASAAADNALCLALVSQLYLLLSRKPGSR